MVTRDLTRDVVRGLSTLEMEFVETTDNQWFKHAEFSAPQYAITSTISYADTIYPAFAFLGGMGPQRAWYRSIGLIGLGLGFNTLRAIDLEQVMEAAKGRHATIQRRQRRRELIERMERRASRGLADSLLSVESLQYDEDADEEAMEELEEEEEELEQEDLKMHPPNYLRLPGVLQRTGLCSLLFQTCCTLNEDWTMSWWFPLTVGSAWSFISFYAFSTRSFLVPRGFETHSPSDPYASPQLSAQTIIDTRVFGSHRLYQAANDPEGLLTVLTGTLSLWSGAKFVSAVTSTNMSAASALGLGIGSVCAGIGLAKLFPRHFPVSKRLWTPSFVFVTSGTSIIKYVLVGMLTTCLPEWVTYPLSCLGQRSLEIYFYGALVRKLLKSYRAHTTKDGSYWMRMKRWLNRHLHREWLSDLMLVLGFEGLLTVVAVYLVKTGIRIIYY